MKTTIVCGLLGSGKTTFIRNRLQNNSEKTVVLVNDFGSAGIDGEIFSAAGIESVELPSGCVCCTLKPDLIQTIAKIVKNFSPEQLLIEPSGVASPSGVLEALQSAGIDRVSVIGIVDVTEFTDLLDSGMYGSFFEDQIVHSDVILVNKVDLADKEKIGETMNRIERINPRAILFRTVKAQLLAPLADSILDAALTREGSDRSRNFSDCVDGRRGQFRFETLSFKLAGKSDLLRFSRFFEELSRGRFGNVVRGKALVNFSEGPFRFDSVFGKTERVPFERDVTESRLVVIGEELDKAAIEKALAGT